MAKTDFTKQHHARQEEEDQPWLFTYADMITLLMAFFVVLISMSTLDYSKVEQMTQHFAKKDTMTLKQLEQLIKEFIQSENLEQEVNVQLTDKGVEISFKDKLLFNIAKADLKEAAKDILTKISGLLNYGDITRRKISVEGHTDSVPIKSDVFPSNWELSSARAASVVKYFIEHNLDSRRFESIGFADTRPVTPETKDKRGLSENRRVVVVVNPQNFMDEVLRNSMSAEAYKNYMRTPPKERNKLEL